MTNLIIIVRSMGDLSREEMKHKLLDDRVRILCNRIHHLLTFNVVLML